MAESNLDMELLTNILLNSPNVLARDNKMTLMILLVASDWGQQSFLLAFKIEKVTAATLSDLPSVIHLHCPGHCC